MNTATISTIDYEGRGVARPKGKTTFIANALPLETVAYDIRHSKASFDEAAATEIVHASPYRREPRCPHYGECGGCALQHAEFSAQVALKQRIFEEQLQRIGNIMPEQLLPPIYGTAWHYRSRTRLAIHTQADGTLLLGYQGKRSKRIVNIDCCPMLPERVSAMLPQLRAELQNLHRRQARCRISALEIHIAEQACALTLHSQKPFAADALHAFAAAFPDHQIWTQTGTHAARPFPPEAKPQLAYRLPEFNITLPYCPGDFTQINTALNELMVARAVRMLDPKPDDTVADLFCGLGNFSLPLARSGARLIGIEGADSLTHRARDNARRNGLNNIEFHTADLFDTTPDTVRAWGKIDKMLLDPPRAGAYALVRALHAPYLPQRIVYVSCNPATFARDAAVLVEKGYRFRSAGIMNMFPHTAHVEAIACFELP